MSTAVEPHHSSTSTVTSFTMTCYDLSHPPLPARAERGAFGKGKVRGHLPWLVHTLGVLAAVEGKKKRDVLLFRPPDSCSVKKRKRVKLGLKSGEDRFSGVPFSVPNLKVKLLSP